MRVHFFEEFPSDKSLSKINLIDFPCKVFLASKSFQEFHLLANKFEKKNVEFIWWPLLPEAQGYWFSPFVPTKLLKQKLSELNNKTVMWDAEFPKNRLLLFNPQFFYNKKLIDDFFKKNSKNIYTSEHLFGQRVLQNLGLSFPSHKNKVIKMMYSSMHKKAFHLLQSEIKSSHELFGDRLVVGLGCLDIGILGDEPLITPKNLERDFYFCKELGIKEVVLFRLGGLNNSYLKIIKKFLS